MDKVRHVSTCGKVSLGLGTVVAVPSVLVHGVEGHATILYGSCLGAHDVPWVVKCGLPHNAFRKDYMARLRALLPSPVAQSQDSMLSPVSAGPVSLRHARSAELELESPSRNRRAKRRVRPVRRVVGDSVGNDCNSHDSGYLGLAG